MKFPTKRIFYHFGVTRSAFGTEASILVCEHAYPRTSAPAPPRPPATCAPAPAPATCAQKSLVAERYQAFNEAKSLS